MNHPQNVKLFGELQQRVRLTEKRFMHPPFDLDLIVQDVARKPELKRRFEEYEGDVSGRTLGSWSYMSRLLGERPAKLDSIFEQEIKYQSDVGYFGEDQKKLNWDFWGRQTFGHGRLLGGLVQYYLLTHDERALQAATRLGDYFVRSIPAWTSAFADNPWTNRNDWVEWKSSTSNRQHFVKTHMTSILESLMMLYDINPGQAYLDAGKKLVELFPEFGQYHSHSYMNTMTGMAMLYGRTGDHDVFSRLYKLYWQDVIRRGWQIDGGIREWFPSDRRTEGCSITDWIRLNLYLWEITQNAVYLDEAENAWFNALNFHQTANGAFGHAICNPNGYESGYSESWWCCTMHGLWAYADLVNFAAASIDDELWFNFYAPISFDLNVGGGEARFRIETNYPSAGLIRIKYTSKEKASVATHLRIPHWAKSFVVSLNGKAVKGNFRRGVFSFEHAWKNQDVLQIELPISLRIVDERGQSLLDRRSLSDTPYDGYFFYGALLLGVDKKNNRDYPSEIQFDASKNYRKSGGQASFSTNVRFMLPAMYNGWESTVTLAPISEITGHQAWTDEWRNFIRNGEKPIERTAVRIRQRIKIRR